MIFDTNNEFFRIIRFCIITIGIGVIIMTFLIPDVFAYSGSLEPDSFYINNQTTQPFNITISGNSSTNVSFHLVWDWYHGSSSNLDLPGSYMFFSIVSDKQIDIDRVASFGSNCTNSCFSNDDYLQLIDDNNGYSYVYYFNIVKWQRNIGTQVDLFNVDDVFKFINKESGTANVYVYGAYADTTNQIPQYINNVNTLQEIIIDNERQTQDIINSNKVCTNYNSIFTDNKYLNEYGNLMDTSNFGVSDYINIEFSNLSISNVNTFNSWACFYKSDKSLISCVNQNTLSNGSYTAPNDSSYLRFSVRHSVLTPTWIVCKNGNQLISDNQNEINNSINDINNNITDATITYPDDDFQDMEEFLATNGTITNLIVLPITLYSAILNNINGTCSNFSLGSLFGIDISFSCISIQSLVGVNLFNVIDVLISGFFVYRVAKKMIKVFHNFSELKEGDVLDD